MESLSLMGLAASANQLGRLTERLGRVLNNLSLLAATVSESEDAVRKLGPASECLRTRRAESELAAAKLELGVKQFRPEWREFSMSIEELLASLEAAPLLEVCPD